MVSVMLWRFALGKAIYQNEHGYVFATLRLLNNGFWRCDGSRVSHFALRQAMDEVEDRYRFILQHQPLTNSAVN